MCVENENEVLKFSEKDVKDLLGAAAAIKRIEPEIKCINSMLMQNAKAIDKEIEDRKKEDEEIKDNYIQRFNKMDNEITVVNQEVKKLERNIMEKITEALKGQVKMLWIILAAILGSTIILFFALTWENVLGKLF